MLNPRAMPTTSFPGELRLAKFCRTFSVAYLLAALLFALAPGLTFRLATLGSDVALLPPEARFWNALAVAMEVACGVACAVVAGDPASDGMRCCRSSRQNSPRACSRLRT